MNSYLSQPSLQSNLGTTLLRQEQMRTLQLSGATSPIQVLGGRSGCLVVVRYFNPYTFSSLINTSKF